MSKKLKMLIVDHAEDDRITLYHIFNNEYYILEADNGYMAKAILEEHPDTMIVLLNIEAADAGALELMTYLKSTELLGKIPVVLSMTCEKEECENKIQEWKASDYILKPYRPAIVKNRISGAVARFMFEKKKMENVLNSTLNDLRYRAERDTLTGVYNGDTFYKRTEEMIKESRDEYVLIVWNVERFKIINDMLGQQRGNEILKVLAQKFRKGLKGKGIVGRLEGDRFATCFSEKIFDLDSILESVNNKKDSYGVRYNIFINFGIYHIQDKTLPIANMCDRAILALQTIRENYLTHYAIYEEALRDKLLEEQEMSAEIEVAIHEKQFCVYLQPIYSVLDKCMASAEALVRWNHPIKGLVSPGNFVPLFEKNGLITKIDMFVLEEVCCFLEKMIYEEQINMVPISVNLSRINFYDDNLGSTIWEMVERHHIPPNMLRFEITESVYTDNKSQLLTTMKILQENGFKILMDDFGSGYSSLNMLKDVPVDILKIDMNFIDNLENSKRAGNIVTSVVRMAKWLNMKVVAEGVETKSQLDFLRSIGCDNIQGYYFSKPMPMEQFGYGMKYNKTILEKESQDDILSLYELDGVWESDKKMDLLFNEMIGGMGIYELSGDTLEIVRANTGYFEIMRDTVEISENVIERVYEADRTLLLNECKRAEKTKRVEEILIRRWRTDGALIWLNIKMRFLAKTGERSLLYFAFNDVTAQKEQEHDQHMNQYKLVLSEMYDEIFALNYSNEVCTPIKIGKDSLYSFSEKLKLSEFIKAYLKNIYIEDRAYFYNVFLNEANQSLKRDKFSFETRIYKKDDKYHWVEMVIIRLDDPIGKRVYLVCNRDIDEQKRAEKQDLQHFLNNIPVGIGIYELGNTIRIRYINDQVYQMFQFNQEEMEDIDISKYVFYEEESYNKMRRCIGKGKIYNDNVFLCRKSNGSDMWIRALVTIMPEKKGKCVCYAVLTDVTEQIQMGRNVKFKDNLKLRKERKKILVVDDIKVNRLVIKETLSDKYDIIEAENGQEALEILHVDQGKFDLVILDIMMPIMDGFELLCEMHKEIKLIKIPVVIITAMDDTENELKAFTMGVIDVIHKPFDADVLKKRIENLLRLAEMERIETENYMLQKHQEIKNQLEAILEGSPGGIYRIQFEGGKEPIVFGNSKLIYVNETFFQMRNISRKMEGNIEESGYIVSQYVKEDAERVIEEIKKATKKKRRFLKADMRILLPNGEIKYVLCNSAITYEKDAIIMDVIETDVTKQKVAEKKLRENNVFLDIIKNVVLPNTKVGLWRYDILHRRMVEVPFSVQNLILNNTLEEIGEKVLCKKYIPAKSWEKAKEMFSRIERGEKIVEETFLVNEKGEGDGLGLYRWNHVTYTTIFDEKGMPVSAIGISEDISEQIENELKYKKEKQYKEINWNESLAFAEINLSKNKVEQEKTKLFGRSQKFIYDSYIELINICAEQMVCREDKSLFLQTMNLESLLNSYKKGMKEIQFNFKAILRKENKPIWVTSVTQLICDDLSGDIYANWQVKNMDESQKEALELGEAAKKDSLTKLCNRYEMERTVNAILKKNREDKEYAALIMIDLDNFKMVNDTFGHEYGDEVLIKVANTLKSIFRSEDYVGRIGGDEFIIFIPSIQDRSVTETRAKLICDRLNMKFENEDKVVTISCSVGIAFAPPVGGDFKTLYSGADKAQYKAKNAGKNQYFIFNKE